MSMNTVERGRRELFWMLKKWSSYRVWEHYAKQFDIFVTAYEAAVATWPKGEAPPERNLQLAYQAQSLFQKGLQELAIGRRYVWRSKFRGDSYLSEAESKSFRAMEGITSEEINRFEGGERGVPDYAQWTPRLEQLRLLKEKTLVKGLELVREPVGTYADWKPTPNCLVTSGTQSITSYLKGNLAVYGGVPAECPALPVATNILVESGDTISEDGIWELVNLDNSPTDRLCYFIKGSTAPWLEDFTHDEGPGKQFTIPTSWRLVWKDDRYINGVIPVESEYLLDYTQQETAAADNTIQTIPPASNRVDAGKICPQSGYWYTPAKQNSRALFKQGDVMPDFPDSSYGVTIWYWDQN